MKLKQASMAGRRGLVNSTDHATQYSPTSGGDDPLPSQLTVSIGHATEELKYEINSPREDQKGVAYLYSHVPGTSSTGRSSPLVIHAEGDIDSLPSISIRDESEVGIDLSTQRRGGAANPAGALQQHVICIETGRRGDQQHSTTLQQLVDSPLLSHHNTGNPPPTTTTVLIQDNPHHQPTATLTLPLSMYPSMRYEAIICGECGFTFDKEEELRLHMVQHVTTFLPSSATASPSSPHGANVKPTVVTEQRVVVTLPAAVVDEKRKLQTKKVPAKKGPAPQGSQSADGKPRPWICKICNKGFRQRGQLDIHARSHTGEKPYGCSVCGKTFRQVAHIQNHTRIHTGERPFSCEICQKRFVQQTHLSNHMKCHQRRDNNKTTADGEVQSPIGTVSFATVATPTSNVLLSISGAPATWNQKTTKSVSVIPTLHLN